MDKDDKKFIQDRVALGESINYALAGWRKTPVAQNMAGTVSILLPGQLSDISEKVKNAIDQKRSMDRALNDFLKQLNSGANNAEEIK
jgi:hypothetical protein